MTYSTVGLTSLPCTIPASRATRTAMETNTMRTRTLWVSLILVPVRISCALIWLLKFWITVTWTALRRSCCNILIREGNHPWEEVGSFLTYYCKTPAHLDPENLVVLNGCHSVFSVLTMVLCDSGEAFLTPHHLLWWLPLQLPPVCESWADACPPRQWDHRCEHPSFPAQV